MERSPFILERGKARKVVNLKMPFKITLKAARMNLGFTLKEAAKLFDIHYQTLSNYENDSTNVPRTFIIKAESIYGVPSENIYFGISKDFIEEMREELLLKHA